MKGVGWIQTPFASEGGVQSKITHAGSFTDFINLLILLLELNKETIDRVKDNQISTSSR